MFLRLRPLLACALFSSPLSHAAEAPTESDAGIWTGIEHRREHYEQASGESDVRSDSITLSPWYERGPWRAELVLPFTRREVEVSGTVQVQPGLLGLFSAEPVTYSESTTETGLEDVSARVTRVTWLDDAWHVWLAGEYKHDNGDAEKGFGTDSRDLSAKPGIGVIGARGYLLLEAGYTWVREGDYARDDHASWMAAAGLNLTDDLLLGVDYVREERLREGGEPWQEWRYLAQWYVTDELGVSLSWYERQAEVEPDTDWSLGFTLAL